MSLFTSFRYLVALHREKHFGRAADACHITQPALSNAIRALEEEFGTAIVKRGRAFESFTPEGELIFISAQRMLHEQELLQQTLKGHSEQPVGALTLGAVPSAEPIAARFAGHLHALYPGLKLTVRSMSSPEIEAGCHESIHRTVFLAAQGVQSGQIRLANCGSTNFLEHRVEIAPVFADTGDAQPDNRGCKFQENWSLRSTGHSNQFHPHLGPDGVGR